MADAWVITARLAADGTLALDRDGGSPWDGSPVDWLTAAIAGCFVKSCHMVLDARREARVAVTATVTAERAPDSPARVGAVGIVWAMPDLAPEQAERIARDAKRICTVTNSMTPTFTLVRE